MSRDAPRCRRAIPGRRPRRFQLGTHSAPGAAPRGAPNDDARAAPGDDARTAPGANTVPIPAPPMLLAFGPLGISLFPIAAAVSVFFSVACRRIERLRGVRNGFLGLFILQSIAFAAMSLSTREGPAPTSLEHLMSNNALVPLENKPCCVISTSTPTAEDERHLPPLPFPGGVDSAQEAMELVQSIILTNGLRVPHRSATLLAETTWHGGNVGFHHFCFRVGLFRFSDDVELLYDATARTIHFRSALRAGQGDFGVNADRMLALRHALARAKAL